MMAGMQNESVLDVSITGEPIRLGQFMKLANLAENGAHVKDLLEADLVTVNDEPEIRRGRQLAHGDVVTVGTERRRVVLS